MCRAASVSAAPTRVCWESSGVYHGGGQVDHRGEALIGLIGANSSSLPKKFAGGWFIEPQAQLVYQNININDANDIAAQVRFADVNSLAGRIGARFGRTWIDDSSRTITAWIRPNLWNEFQGNPTTLFSSATRLRSVPRRSRRSMGRNQRRHQRPSNFENDAFCQCFLPEPVRRRRLRLHRKGRAAG